jgi:uncharacterized protein (DUF2336 family)
MAIAISPQDVDRLLSESSSDVRADLADKVASNLTGSSITPAEIKVALDIVRILARDVEERVRASISRGLRHSAHLPRDVAQKLADDVDAVALPLLIATLILTDEDLVTLVRSGSPSKQEVIASRPNLTELVSEVLITQSEEPAVAALMGNLSASIAEQSLHHAIARFAGSDRIKQAMVVRPNLPITVSERLVALVSEELQQHLLRSQVLSAGIAADIVLRSREQAIMYLSGGSSGTELSRMIAQMYANGRLTPTLMLRALCTGDMAFFEFALAVRGGVPLANAQILIHEPGRRGLAALYRKATMPENLFGVVRTAIDVVDETEFDGDTRDLERFRTRVISRILTVKLPFEAADADYLIAKMMDILEQSPEPQKHQAHPQSDAYLETDLQIRLAEPPPE